jgi:hypothetical protein
VVAFNTSQARSPVSFTTSTPWRVLRFTVFSTAVAPALSLRRFGLVADFRAAGLVGRFRVARRLAAGRRFAGFRVPVFLFEPAFADFLLRAMGSSVLMVKPLDVPTQRAAR